MQFDKIRLLRRGDRSNNVSNLYQRAHAGEVLVHLGTIGKVLSHPFHQLQETVVH